MALEGDLQGGFGVAEERLSPESTDYIEVLFHWHRYLAVAGLCKAKVVLDVACGDGYGTYYLSQFAAKVVGVDIDPNTIQRAKSKYNRHNLIYMQGLAENLEFPTGSFDVVVSFETIEHLSRENQEQFLSEVKRVLKPNGLFIVSTPDRARTEKFLASNPFHLNELYYDEFISILKGYFSKVDAYLQEVNLASIIWPSIISTDIEAPFRLQNYSVEYANGKTRPTNKSLSLHLYVIALCLNKLGDHKKDISSFNLSSLCQEINRKPIEVTWSQIQVLNTKLKKVFFDKRLLENHNFVMAQELDNLYKQNAILGDELIRLQQDKAALAAQLEIIEQSRSWRLVRKYWTLMDRPFWRLLLAPIRKVGIWIWRIGKR